MDMPVLTADNKENAKGFAIDVAQIALSQGGIALANETGFPVGLMLEAGYTLKELTEIWRGNKKQLPINPYLGSKGLNFDNGPSPATKDYLTKRKFKKLGSQFVSVAGTGLQVGLDVAGMGIGGVDPLALAKHGTAEVSTIAHLARLTGLSRKVKQSKYLQGLIYDMIKIKSAKAVVRGGRIAAAAIPNTVASNSVSLAISVGAAGTQVLVNYVSDKVAAQVHARAFVELSVGSVAGGGFGPACRMAQELMNHIKSTSTVPSEQVKKFLREPAGFMVIADKLKML